VIIAMAVALAIINIVVIRLSLVCFKNFNAELPLMTRILIGFSDFTVNYWPVLIALAIGAVLDSGRGLRRARASTRGTSSSSACRSWARSSRQATLGRFSRGLALCLKSGIPAVQALSVVARVTDNDYIASASSDA